MSGRTRAYVASTVAGLVGVACGLLQPSLAIAAVIGLLAIYAVTRLAGWTVPARAALIALLGVMLAICARWSLEGRTYRVAEALYRSAAVNDCGDERALLAAVEGLPRLMLPVTVVGVGESCATLRAEGALGTPCILAQGGHWECGHSSLD